MMNSRHSNLLLTLSLLAVALTATQPIYAASPSQQDASASDSKLRLRAEQGDAVAQYNLAQSYLRHDPTNGQNPTSEDYQSALKRLLASAARNYPEAQFLLGYLYEHGQGVLRDYAKSAENYRAAALQGHSTAENNLASLYQHGQGVPKDFGKAFDWYLASAQHGNQVGQCNLASLYYLGSGTRQDYRQAARWFRAAADSGSAEAQNTLAIFYYKGLGVPLDYAEAARWLQLAAQQGLPDAETNLAYFYEQGRGGLPLDYVTAYVWYSHAIAAGDASGFERRKQLAQLLTRKQIAAATALVSNCLSNCQRQPTSVAVGTFSLIPSH